jgi:hypothetical protein
LFDKPETKMMLGTIQRILVVLMLLGAKRVRPHGRTWG